MLQWRCADVQFSMLRFSSRALLFILLHPSCVASAARLRQFFGVFASTSLVQSTARDIAWPDDWDGKIVRTITVGAGSNTKIYFTELKCDGTYVAVKALNRLVKDKDGKDLMGEEVALLETFSDSPRFITLFRNARSESEGFIMMEAALGGDFYNIIASSIAKETKMRLWFEVVDGIHYMHSKQILHRDLNPANLMLSLKCDLAYPCKAKIGDLAQACSLANPPMVEGVPVCDPRGKCGAYSYCAPEIFQTSMLTAKSDVWALGLMLYELLFDRLPEAIADAAHEEELASAVSDDFIKNDNMFPRVPEALQGLLAGMLRSELDARMSSADALAQARDLRMPLLGLPEEFDNNDKPAPMPCWDDRDLEPAKADPDVHEVTDDLATSIKQSLQKYKYPLDGSVPGTDGQTGQIDYLYIAETPNDVTRLIVDPELVDPDGKVIGEAGKRTPPWPSELPLNAVLLEINRRAYSEVYKKFNGGLNAAKEEFEKNVRMKYQSRWLVKYWVPDGKAKAKESSTQV